MDIDHVPVRQGCDTVQRHISPQTCRHQHTPETHGVDQVIDHALIEAVFHITKEKFGFTWQPGTRDTIRREAIGLGECRGFLCEDFVVQWRALIGQHQITEMAGQVIFIGDQCTDDTGITCIGMTGIGVYVAQIIFIELLHRGFDAVIEVIIAA